MWGSQDRPKNISLVEKEVIHLALVAFEEKVRCKYLLMVAENQTSLLYQKKGVWAGILTLLAGQTDLGVGQEQSGNHPYMFHAVADSWSRSVQILPKEWVLHRDVYRGIWSLQWGPND